MKKSDFKFENVVNKIVKGDEAARSVPFDKGDELFFTLSDDLFKSRKEVISNQEREWTDVVMDDGSAISASQITRNRNGLNLSGATVKEKLQSFTDLFSDEGTLKLKISNVRSREFVDNEGNRSTSRYLMFELA